MVMYGANPYPQNKGVKDMTYEQAEIIISILGDIKVWVGAIYVAIAFFGLIWLWRK